MAVYRTELDQGWDGYQTLLKNIEALKAQVSGETEQDQELSQEIRELEAQAQETKTDTGCERTGLPDKEERTGHSKTAAYEWESRAGSGKSAAGCK